MKNKLRQCSSSAFWPTAVVPAALMVLVLWPEKFENQYYRLYQNRRAKILAVSNQNVKTIGIVSYGDFLASSGALTDVAVDITSAIHEVAENRPGLSRLMAIAAGLNVYQAALGTMTATLLLAYSGS